VACGEHFVSRRTARAPLLAGACLSTRTTRRQRRPCSTIAGGSLARTLVSVRAIALVMVSRGDGEEYVHKGAEHGVN
jgi:hypothetical protein